MRLHPFAAAALVGFSALLAAACGAPDPDPPAPAPELVACDNPAHVGLLCLVNEAEVGSCTPDLVCVKLPCREDHDCNDFSFDPCRVFTCDQGTCITSSVSEGFICAVPKVGGEGLCQSGTCDVIPCVSVADCPALPECLDPTCSAAGVCGSTNAPDGLACQGGSCSHGTCRP